MVDKRDFSLLQLDVLREVGTITSARAATALSEILNCKVEISLPEAKVVPLKELGKILGNPEEVYFVLDIALEKELEGRLFFLLLPEQAKALGEVLLKRAIEEPLLEDEFFCSSLKEIVNILAGSYMNALFEFTGLTVIYSIPSLGVDMVSALMDFFFIYMAQESDEVILVDTRFKVEDKDLKGFFLFFLSWNSLKKLTERLGMNNN
ncbi:MAG: hypothetical protein B6D56_04125 [Candidatus Omnitrophica bacterium 4484_70.1]|nr:MAG: hypothetical protein B6D56_04125 [Candidatus Omnitrophica bacterium 4484_70.1]